MKRLALFVVAFNKAALGKDAFMVPYYWGKMNNMEVSIYYPQTKENADFPSIYRGVRLCPLKFKSTNRCFSFMGEWFFLFYILQKAKSIDVLMRFHFSYQTLLIGVLYKIINQKGILYIKGDGYGIISSLMRKKINFIAKMNNSLIRKSVNKMLTVADLISVEHEEIYNIIFNSLYGLKLKTRLVQLYNGFDEELIKSYKIDTKSFNDKENIFITVGRLGSYQKNTEMILKSVSQIDLKDWKLILIGPIEEKERNFKEYIENFYLKNPNLKDKVLFTGPIWDKKLLWEYYNKAKVFILSSRTEGYALVYLEAVRFNNYILTTDVGGAFDTLKIGRGEIINQEDSSQLSSKMEDIISNRNNIDILFDNVSDKAEISWEILVKNKLGEIEKFAKCL